MRNASELKFNPIRFYSYGTTGQTGTKSLEEFFRAALPQNICYCVRRQAKTINEIADDLVYRRYMLRVKWNFWRSMVSY